MALPALGDLEFVREQTAKVIGRSIELPFSLAQDTQDKERDFVLYALIVAEQGEPTWALAHITPNGKEILWQHISTDTSLIHSLVKRKVLAVLRALISQFCQQLLQEKI